MGKKQQKIEIAKWEAPQPKLKAARDKRGIWETPDDDKDYLKIVSDLRAKLSVPAAPAMPLFQTVMAAPLGAKGDLQPKKKRGAQRQHQDKVADKGPSIDWFGLLHTPIPIPKALKVPAAREALHSEWAKLEGKHAWDVKAVRLKAQVTKEAKAEGRSVHFGSLIELCSIRNTQLGKEFWMYKGRLVFRGDIVKDENGQFAVFT